MTRLPIWATVLLAVGTLIAACGGVGPRTGHPVSTPTGAVSPHPPSKGSPPPPGQPLGGASLWVSDLSWVSDQDGWAIGTANGCAATSANCTDVLRTTDGGVQWTQLGTIPTPPGQVLNQIKFANSEVGYAFVANGQFAAYMTLNGGRSWQLMPGPPVAALKVLGGTVVAVRFNHSGCPGPCAWSVDAAPIGSTEWRTLIDPPDNQVNHGSAILVTQGPDTIYAAFPSNPAQGVVRPGGQFLISHNGGTTWSRIGSPCREGGITQGMTINVAAAPAQVLAVLCLESPSQLSEYVRVSTNGGDTFGPPRAVAGNGSFSQLAVTSGSSLFVGNAVSGGSGAYGYQLMGSFDGGLRWSTLASQTAALPGPRTAPSDCLGFEDAAHGRWIGGASSLWTTSDGGRSWSESAF